MRIYRYTPLFLQKIIWVPTRMLLKYFGNLEVIGLENIKNLKENVIFACNHTSELDPVLLPASLPFFSNFSPIFYASRTKNLYDNSGWRSYLYGGNLFKLWGAYPVFFGLKNYEKSMRHHINIVSNGDSICVFPEGKVTKDGSIQPAKGGVSYLSHVTNTRIVPVKFEGAFNISLKDFFSRKRFLKVKFGKPLEIIGKNNVTEISKIEDYKIYANFVMNLIKDL